MSQISTFSVYDSRIVQESSAYAVYKGAESITNTPFQAISKNANQHTFTINVPSPNIFVERQMPWSSDCNLQFTVSVVAGAAPLPALTQMDPIISFGKDLCLAPFPLHTMVNGMQATINDCVVTMNTSEMLPEVLRLADFKKNINQRTCPSALDNYQNYNDAYGTVGSVLANYSEVGIHGIVPNGAYPRVWFCKPAGGDVVILNQVGADTYLYAGRNVYSWNGIPVLASTARAGANGYLDAVLNGADLLTIPIFIKFRSTENLVLSPLVFNEQKSNSIGLFGINNIQVLMNMGQPNRALRNTTANGRTIDVNSVAYFAANPFATSVINCTFLTPSISVPLPSVSMVPWMEFPRYTSAPGTVVPAGSGFLGAGGGVSIQTNNVVLSCIPDMFILYAKPAAGYAYNEADYHLPITNISINFNNFSGLCNSYSPEQLYELSVRNGLEMDYEQWSGMAMSAKGRKTPMCGGMLILKAGRDFALPTGLASGLNGNFNFQANITFTNPTANNVTPIIYLLAVNSGFFESIGGTSRIRRAPLTEAAILESPVGGPVTDQHLKRLVGGGIWSSLGNIYSKIKHFYNHTKPYVSAVKNVLPEGAVKSTLSKLGYGKHGARSASDRVA